MSGLFAGTPLERPVTCEDCAQPLESCTCPRNRDGAVTRPADQSPRVQREKRRGAWVTVIHGLDPVASDLSAMQRELSRRFASGGSARDGRIELQGDHRDAVVAWLVERGYRARAAGG